METTVAWIVVAAAGLGTLAGIFVLTRRIGNAWLRSLLRCLAAVWLLLPWNIQVVEGEYAPAFIVALFEGVFRADGNPRPALMVLAMTSLLVIIVFLIVGAVQRIRASKA
jgi:hypothetical protein